MRQLFLEPYKHVSTGTEMCQVQRRGFHCSRMWDLHAGSVREDACISLTQRLPEVAPFLIMMASAGQPGRHVALLM